LAIEVDDALIVIFDFISADTGFDYDLQHFGKTLGDVHVLTAELKNQLPSRGFSSSREDFFNETIPRLTSHQTGDDVTKALSGILQQYSDETNAIIDAFFRLKSLCTKKPVSFVNTHGDVHGNVLVRTPHDFYIIDWDEMEKGPAERDLWFLSEKPEFMHGYRLARPDFVLDADAAKHALLKNYLEGIAIFVMPILDRRLAPETRLKKIQVLENKRLNGWMKPRIREIICAGPYEDPT
jgi:hypothetical protein